MRLVKMIYQKCRKGNGSVLFSVAVIIPMFLLMILSAERFHIYTTGIRVQTSTDSIATAVAENSKRAYGMDVITAYITMLRMDTYLNDDGKFYGLINPVGLSYDNIQVLGAYQDTTLFSGQSYSLNASAISRIVVDAINAIDYDAFPQDYTQRSHPNYTSTAAKRSQNKYYDVVKQFHIADGNLRYENAPVDLRSVVLLWDFSVAMGCEISAKENGALRSMSSLYSWLTGTRGYFAGWRRASSSQIYSLVNDSGKPVIAVSANDSMIFVPDMDNTGAVLCSYAGINGMVDSGYPGDLSGYVILYHK